jgi:MtN3 and saliva related transmembrane protein
MNWEFIGLIAGITTISGFLPQIYRGYKTKHLNDISYLMLILMGIGMSLWLLYGLNLNSNPIILANTAGVICTVTLILMKFRYSNNNQIN